MAATNNREVYDSALVCQKNLEILTRPPSLLTDNDLRLMRNNSQQFALWSGYLGVFARQNISLDSRLELAPGIKQLVLDLLNLLKSDTIHGKILRRTLWSPQGRGYYGCPIVC